MIDVLDKVKGSTIQAPFGSIGKNLVYGKNVRIKVRSSLIIGKNCHFGDDVSIEAENLYIGDDFFHHEPGLRIGGGGSHVSAANLSIGNRCVMHNNYINLTALVAIGNDVGLSPDVDFLTHGFWGSILDGYPTVYEGISIGNGVIIGQRSFVLPGVTIANNVVIGANSTVSKSCLSPKSVYAGNPIRFLREIKEPTVGERLTLAQQVLRAYVGPGKLKLEYPWVICERLNINLEERMCVGTETLVTDDFRDHLRRYGIKVYTDRPFVKLP